MTQAYIYDAVRTPRGKARAEGGLAKMKPQELVAGLVDRAVAGQLGDLLTA